MIGTDDGLFFQVLLEGDCSSSDNDGLAADLLLISKMATTQQNMQQDYQAGWVEVIWEWELSWICRGTNFPHTESRFLLTLRNDCVCRMVL